MQEFSETSRTHDEAKKIRGSEIELLSGVWEGESSIDNCATPTLWGDVELTFTREFRLKGSGTSKWNGQDVNFCLVGAVDSETLRFEMYKTHIGRFTNTIVFRGQLELVPPKLCGRSLKGSVTLARVRALPAKPRSIKAEIPSVPVLREPAGASPRPSISSSPPPSSSLSATRENSKDARRTREQTFDSTTESGRRGSERVNARETMMRERETEGERERRASASERERQSETTGRLFDQHVHDRQHHHPQQQHDSTGMYVPGYSVALSADQAPAESESRLYSFYIVPGEDFPTTPSPHVSAKHLRRTATGGSAVGPELEEDFPSSPPESPQGPLQCAPGHSALYTDPILLPSAAAPKTGDPEVDAAALCGVWAGASIKKNQSHPNGEPTAWEDVVMYFNLGEGAQGTVRGRGESIWRGSTIPFLLEGSFDLERGTVQLRKFHVGKFNNILSYDLTLGSAENLLVIKTTTDDGSVELKQLSQVCDSEALHMRAHSPRPAQFYHSSSNPATPGSYSVVRPSSPKAHSSFLAYPSSPQPRSSYPSSPSQPTSPYQPTQPISPYQPTGHPTYQPTGTGHPFQSAGLFPTSPMFPGQPGAASLVPPPSPLSQPAGPSFQSTDPLPSPSASLPISHPLAALLADPAGPDPTAQLTFQPTDPPSDPLYHQPTEPPLSLQQQPIGPATGQQQPIGPATGQQQPIGPATGQQLTSPTYQSIGPATGQLLGQLTSPTHQLMGMATGQIIAQLTSPTYQPTGLPAPGSYSVSSPRADSSSTSQLSTSQLSAAQLSSPTLYAQTRDATAFLSPSGSVYNTLTSSATPARKSSHSSPTPFSKSEPPTYTLLPASALEEASDLSDRAGRDDRISKYSLYLSGMVLADCLSSQQQKALATYRANHGISEEEHRAALDALNLCPSEFARKLRTPSDDMCKVCFERQIDCVLLPCGHLTTCIKCSSPLKICPVCCGVIKEKRRVYRT